MRFLDHIQRRATVGRTPLNEWSVRRRDLYLTTHNTHNTNIHALGGIRHHDLSRRAAVDLRLRPRGHLDRLLKVYYNRKLYDSTPTGTNVCPTSSIRVGAMSIALAIGSYGLHKWGEIRCREAHIRFRRNPSVSSSVISGRLTRIWQRCYFWFI